MDETSRFESDLSSILADSDFLKEIFESDSPFFRPSSSRLPGMTSSPAPIPQLLLHISPQILRGVADTFLLVSTLEAAP